MCDKITCSVAAIAIAHVSINKVGIGQERKAQAREGTGGEGGQRSTLHYDAKGSRALPIISVSSSFLKKTKTKNLIASYKSFFISENSAAIAAFAASLFLIKSSPIVSSKRRPYVDEECIRVMGNRARFFFKKKKERGRKRKKKSERVL